MGDVQLDYVVPPADLAAYVTVFYRFTSDLVPFDEVERADGAQFRVTLAGCGDYLFANGAAVAAPTIHLTAASHGARRSRSAGPLVVFGCGLTPAGWGALVPPPHRHARVIDSVALLGAPVTALAAALADAPDAEAMAALAVPVLRGLIGVPDPAMLAFVAAVDAWLAGSASPDVAALAAATGLSRRQCERRCNALHGAAPKLLARKVRALRAAAALATGGASVDTLIAEGFYDQSHLIREVKYFTGRTPRQMRDDPGLLAQLTITRKAALRGQVGLLVSDT